MLRRVGHAIKRVDRRAHIITAGMPPSMKVHGKISPITQEPLTPQQSRDLVLNVMSATGPRSAG